MPTMKLLIADDGSACARLAVDDLRNAGLPPELHATVVSVADVIGLPAGAADVGAALPAWLSRSVEQAHEQRRSAVERMRAHAQAGADRLRERFPGWTVEAEAFGDAPAWGILRRAGELNVDLIVLGSHGHSVLGRVVLGSVSLKVLNAASCSVRIARGPHGEPRVPLRLLLGADGSRDSLVAVRAVRSRRWPPGTCVRVVSALDAYMATAVVSQRPDIQRWVQAATESETWVHHMVAAVARELREAGLEAETEVVRGEPQHVLVDAAERWRADGVFLGSQGLSAVQRFVLGSVASAVATRAPCTVEVVRSADGSGSAT